jgi:hypothetical protein
MKHSWQGKDYHELTREELIEARKVSDKRMEDEQRKRMPITYSTGRNPHDQERYYYG